jgi:hypothetical protein
MENIMASRLFSRYLDTNGDGTGTKNVIGTYPGGIQFYVQPAEDEKLVINRLIVFIEDGVVGGFDPTAYGDRGTLDSGIAVQVMDSSDTILLDLTDGLPITSNGQWQRVCFDVSTLDNNTNMTLAVRWTFDKSVPGGYGRVGETPIVLQNRQKFVITVYDDFSDLIDHTFLVQGVQMNQPANLES